MFCHKFEEIPRYNKKSKFPNLKIYPKANLKPQKNSVITKRNCTNSKNYRKSQMSRRCYVRYAEYD